MRATFFLPGLVALMSALPVAPALASPSSVAIHQALSPALRSASNVVLDPDRHPAPVLAFVDIQPGDTIADFSAGAGYYSEPMATLTGPTGKVIAQVSPRFYMAEQWDAIRAVHPNITMLVEVDDDARFASDSLDILFAHLVFHDLFLPDAMGQPHHDARAVLANWFSAVKSGGHVVIVDHVAGEGNVTEVAGRLHRINPLAARAAMEAAGFVFESESSALRHGSDTHQLPFFAPGLRSGTDRFIYKFRKP